MSQEDRLAHLEAAISFQDRTIAELSELIYQQQSRLDALEASVRELQSRPSSPISESDPEAEPPPPHY